LQFEQMFGVFMMTSTLLWTRRDRVRLVVVVVV
jgi:hypothetical protein